MDNPFVIGLSLGAGLGFALAWAYFHAVGLIRSRREFYTARRARGLWVPEDWEKEE